MSAYFSSDHAQGRTVSERPGRHDCRVTMGSSRRRRWRCVVWPLASVLFVAPVLLPVAEVRGQAVQLPTFGHFTVSTTVSVPDGGTMAIAGNRHLSESYAFGARRPLFGPLGTWRTSRRSLYDEQVGVSAAVTDLRQHDARILAEAAARSSVRADRDRGEPTLALGAGSSGSSPAADGPGRSERIDPGHFSVDELRRQREEAESLKQQEARAWFQRAVVAERDGKAAVARAYYRNALRDADEALREEIAARLRSAAEDRVARASKE
jgi:hypothetical protein